MNSTSPKPRSPDPDWWRDLPWSKFVGIVLVNAFKSPGRRWWIQWSIGIVVFGFQHFEPVRDDAEHPEEVELAIWFHDAVYDTKSKDSEERSARFAQRCLLDGGVALESIDRVHCLILATKHLDPPVGADEALLVDTDLSILGAPIDRFDEYEAQVRHEYSWVPLDTYKSERSRILQGFLDRPRVYWSKHFFDTMESRARANLARSIERLLA